MTINRKSAALPVAALVALAGGAGGMAQEPSEIAQTRALGPEVITVTATRTARPVFATPSAISVLDRDALTRFEAPAFSEVLEGVPGVSLLGGPRRIAEEPNIRGFQDTQLVIRVDGARQSFDAAHRGRFFTDPDLLGRIEVLRGSASALYGSGAIGGVISLETATAEDFLRGDQTLGGRIKGVYRSTGAEPQLSGQAFAGGDGWDVLAAALWRDITEDLEDGSGTAIIDSRETVTSGLVNLGWQPAPGHELRLIGEIYDNEGPSPTNATTASEPSTVTDRDTEQQSLRARWTYEGERLSSSLVGYWSDIELAEDRRIDDRLDETAVETLGLDAFASWRAGALGPVETVLSLGGELYRVEQQGRRNGAARAQFPDAEVDFTAIYGQAEFALPGKIDIIPGLRWDRYALSPETSFEAREEDRLTPRIALGWAPVEAAYLWASWGQAFRAPSLTELYSDGTHFTVPLAPGQIVVNEFVPSPDLQPEVAETIEIGARLRGEDLLVAGDHAEASLSYYISDVEDFIDQTVIFIAGPPRFTPPFGPLVFPGQTLNRNAEAELSGGEFALSYQTAGFSAELVGAWYQGEDENGDPLGVLPQNRATLSVTHRWPERGATVGGRWTVTLAREDVPAGALPAKGHGVVDLFASWAPLDRLVLRAGLDNALDQQYRLYPNSLPQPDRSIWLSAAVTF